MKVQIIGTHCTGKTTLIDSIKDVYKEYIIPEQATHLMKQGLIHINHDSTMRDQDIIFNEYARRFVEMEHYISDRGLIDTYAYSSSTVIKSSESFDWELYNRQLDFIKGYMKAFPDVYYVYVPIQWENLEDNGVRDVDASWRKSIDGSIQNICTMLAHEKLLKNFFMVSGTKNEMAEMFNELLDWWWDKGH